MYFQLHDDCKLVSGKSRGAIYNLSSGKVHSISAQALTLLSRCQDHSLAISFAPTDDSEQNAVEFLNKLALLGLGSFFYQLPCRIADSPKIEQPAAVALPLEFLWLELTAACNNRCLHCYSASGPEAAAEPPLPVDVWLKVLREAYESGARSMQLIGGEPLLYPKWRDLALYAEKLGYEYIEIFTNGTLITTEDLPFFKQHQVHIATTIYAANATVHDAVTQNPGSFLRTFTAIKQLLQVGVPLRVASIIMNVNEQEVENIQKLCKNLGIEGNPPDVIRPTGRGDDLRLQPKTYHLPKRRPPFFTDSASFARAKQYHSCLAGKLAVTSTGEVIPCIFSRNQVCGNILTTPLTDIIQGEKLQSCWQLTKNFIEKCSQCEYRYACEDCRPLAQGMDPSRHWLAQPPDCSYNPETGIWEEK